MPKKRRHINVPTVTNLAAAGDSSKKIRTRSKRSGSSHLDELNNRIDEIENAIGQDNTGPVGRAFAIRAETNRVTKPRPAYITDTDLQKN